MAYLEITLKVNESDRPAAAAVYQQYKQPFLDTITSATSFDSAASARAYLSSELFTKDVVGGLTPLLQTEPQVRIYEVA